MTGLQEIHARLRAADVALARVQGGSSELAAVREAAGSLLVALHELTRLYEAQRPAPDAPPRTEGRSVRGGRR